MQQNATAFREGRGVPVGGLPGAFRGCYTLLHQAGFVACCFGAAADLANFREGAEGAREEGRRGSCGGGVVEVTKLY